MATDESSSDSDHLFGQLRRLNTGRLKRVGIVTYFGFYALIALGMRRGVNELLQWLPDDIRPALLAPLDSVFGLPTSIAWSITSLTVSLSVIAVVAGISLYRANPEDDSDDAERTDPFVNPTVVDPDRPPETADDSPADTGDDG